MKTNELKNGAKVILANGWNATIRDNAKGNTRLALVEGYYTELGSVYAHDIVLAVVDGKRVAIEHTPAQHKLRKMVENV